MKTLKTPKHKIAPKKTAKIFAAIKAYEDKNKDFFNVVTRDESAYQDLCDSITDMNLKLKAEKEDL